MPLNVALENYGPLLSGGNLLTQINFVSTVSVTECFHFLLAIQKEQILARDINSLL